MYDITQTLRKLAKTDYYQSIYSIGKETRLSLFENNTDLNSLQMLFLRYVCFYSNLFMDIALGDVDEIVLSHEIYEDSYVMYKNKKDKTKFKNAPNLDVSNTQKGQKIGTSSWIFHKNKSKVGTE